jgi:putative transposase
MRRLDELHLELPFAGSRTLRDLLRAEGVAIGREHVRTLMRRMGITAIYQQAKTTQRHRAHSVFPYLLRAADSRSRITSGRRISRASASRKVLSWRLSPTLTSDFCVAALEEALAHYACLGKLAC